MAKGFVLSIFALFVFFVILFISPAIIAQESSGEITLSVTADKPTYFTTEDVSFTMQASIPLNETDMCDFKFYLPKYNYKVAGEYKSPCIKPAVFHIQNLFYEKWYDSGNRFAEPQPPLYELLDTWKVIVTLQKIGYKEVTGSTTFSIKSSMELKTCTPSFFNPETGAISCDTWTDVKNSLIKIDNVNVTLNPSTVIRARFEDFAGASTASATAAISGLAVGAMGEEKEIFATGIAIEGRTVITVRVDTDNDGVFETKDHVSSKKEQEPGLSGFRDTIAPYRFYAKFSGIDTSKQVIFYITSGEIAIDYLGTEKITENCPRKFDSGVVLQRKKAGLPGSTLTYAMNVSNNDHVSCSPVLYYRNNWIKYSYEDLFMGDLKISDANTVIIPPGSTGIFTTSVTSSPIIKTGDHWFKTYPLVTNGVGGNVMLHYPTFSAVFSVVEKLPTCGNAECEPGEDFETCPQECTKPCDPGLVYSNVTNSCVSEWEVQQQPVSEPAVVSEKEYFSSAKILSVAVELERLKIKFTSLSELSHQISRYYASRNNIDKANAWQLISNKFYSLITEVSSVANYLRQNKNNLNTNTLAEAKRMIDAIENKLIELSVLVLEAV